VTIKKYYKNKVYFSLVVSLIVGNAFISLAVAKSDTQETKLPSKASMVSLEKTVLPTEPTRTLVDQSNPYSMIKGAAEITFKRFANEAQGIKTNPNLLKKIVREELMPYINYKYSALKVIGKHLKKSKKEDVVEFFPVFREYLITSYAQVFTLYDNQEVQFEPEKSFKNKKIIAVNTRIIMQGRDNIDVAFKVRLNKKTKQWQAFDMVAEGVSLLDSKQAELGGIIRQKGLPYVTELLKKKSNRDIVFKNSGKKKAITTIEKTNKAE